MRHTTPTFPDMGGDLPNHRRLTADEKLHLLFRCAGEIAAERSLENLLHRMASLGRSLIGADRCTLWLLDHTRGILWTKVAHGIDRVEIPAGTGIVGRVVETGERYLTADAYADPNFSPEVDRETGYRTRSVLCLPIRDEDGEVRGAFQAINKIDGSFDKSDLEVLDMVTTYSAKSLAAAFLVREIEDTQKDLILLMSEIVEGRSKETGNHVRRVAEISYTLALAAGLEPEEAELIRTASPMHDIGKIAIADSILVKTGALTDEEHRQMRSHTELGRYLLSATDRRIFRAASVIAHQHHEKWDGSGYPNGLAGESIHIYGRITAIADVFDALASPRCYKPAWELPRVRAHFESERGRHFDPKLTDLFLAEFDRYACILNTYCDDRDTYRKEESCSEESSSISEATDAKTRS